MLFFPIAALLLATLAESIPRLRAPPKYLGSAIQGPGGISGGSLSSLFGHEASQMSKAAKVEGVGLPGPATCPPLHDIPNAKNDTKSKTRQQPDTKLTYTCDTGYKQTGGDRERKCKMDGSWSGDDIVCTIITCPMLMVPPRAKMSSNNNRYGAEVGFECMNGCRRISGSYTRLCRSDGTWSGTPIECVRDCKKLDITNAIRTGSSYKYNSRITFKCKTDSKYVSGDKTRTCLTDGTWSGSNIVCKKIPKCSSLRPPSGSRYSIKVYGFTEGSKAVYTCGSQYVKTCGGDTKICKKGTWTGTADIKCAKALSKWKFDGSTKSIVSRSSGARFENTGKLGMGLRLFGYSSSYALVRRVDMSTTSFTINFFMKQTGRIGSMRTVFSDWYIAGSSRWQFLMRINSGNQMTMNLRRNKYNTGSDWRQDMVAVGTKARFGTINRWYAVSFIWDRSKKTATFYVNGQRDSSATSRWADRDLQHSRYKNWYMVGYKGDSRSEWFSGYIVGLSVYSEVLSDQCIKAIHNKIN